jgi:hypothetical protein
MCRFKMFTDYLQFDRTFDFGGNEELGWLKTVDIFSFEVG